MDTVGGVVSATALDTVTFTAVLVVLDFPLHLEPVPPGCGNHLWPLRCSRRLNKARSCLHFRVARHPAGTDAGDPDVISGVGRDCYRSGHCSSIGRRSH